MKARHMNATDNRSADLPAQSETPAAAAIARLEELERAGVPHEVAYEQARLETGF